MNKTYTCSITYYDFLTLNVDEHKKIEIILTINDRDRNLILSKETTDKLILDLKEYLSDLILKLNVKSFFKTYGKSKDKALLKIYTEDDNLAFAFNKNISSTGERKVCLNTTKISQLIKDLETISI